MKAERDIAFGPPSRGAAPASDGPRYRRGEREAHTLKRRRRVHALRRVFPPVVIGLALMTGAWMWVGGVTEALITDARTVMERHAVAAGMVVREVDVVGLDRLALDELLEALAVPRGTPILAVDLKEAQARLAMIGWIRTVSVARRLPDALAITVEERTPAALWQHAGVLTLIDTQGHSITTTGLEPYADLPHLVGAGAPQAAAGLFRALRRDPVLSGRVRAAVRVGGRRWDIVFENGVRARLPETGEAAAWDRLAALEREHGLLNREIHAIDLRQSDRLVLRLTDREIERRRKATAADQEGKV